MKKDKVTDEMKRITKVLRFVDEVMKVTPKDYGKRS